MGEEKNLLDHLWVTLGCEYLSDMRSKEFRTKAIRIALTCSPDKYPSWQWCDAVDYLLNEAKAVKTTAEALAVLRKIEKTLPG